ncbi:MAG: ABC transporter permease subunit, partial [Candidatus Puniceispirillales bacterium]
MASKHSSAIPGIGRQASTDLPVLKPFTPSQPVAFHTSAWLANMPPWTGFVLLLPLILWPFASHAAGSFTMTDEFSALVRWMPFLLKSGFLFNVIISLFAMLIGTVLGIVLGLGQISKNRIIRQFSWFITQLFRNSPWLVLLFIVLLAFPFEVTIFGILIPIPDW